MPNSDEIKKIKSELHKKSLEIKRLKNLVVKDELTGLYNRRGFKEEVEKFFKDVLFIKQNPSLRKHVFIDELSVLFLDIDNFKKVNDTYGHKTGDNVLKFVSSIISQKVRILDRVGRWGGEEIVIALIGANEEDAYQKAEEIRKAIKSRVKIPIHPDLTVTVSCGAATLETGLSSLDELVQRADKAMYEAKHNRGKDNTVKFSELSK